MLRWVSVAPFGNPVVPDVYWMLIGSSGVSRASRSASATRSTSSAGSHSASHSGLQRKIDRSRSGQSPATTPTIAT